MIGHLRFGAGRYIVDMAIDQASRLGHDVTILTSFDIDDNWRTDKNLVHELKQAGINVEVVGDIFTRDNSILLRTAPRLEQLLGSGLKDTIVHAHSAIPAVVARLAGAENIVATCHGWNLDRPKEYEAEDASAFQNCGAVITNSRHWAKRLTDICGIVDPVVIAGGLNMSKFPPLKSPENRFHEPVKIVSVSELTHRKGVDVLIDAFINVRERFEKCELHILGDGDMSDTLHKQAERLGGDSSSIVFHGAVSFPYNEFSDYDLFSIPSRSDNYPVAIIEAMLGGLPVVGTDAGGIPEMIKDGQCGVVVEPESAESLASGILDLLERGQDQLRDLGSNGEKFARECLGVEPATNATQKVYKNVVSRNFAQNHN
jgi:glycosyltransferase involved in cell wall biosynthesis